MYIEQSRGCGNHSTFDGLQTGHCGGRGGAVPVSESQLANAIAITVKNINKLFSL
jgi:hypothetical protein